MLAQILLILKGILEAVGLAKYFYAEFKTTPVQNNQKIDDEIQAEKAKAENEGRPS